MNLTLYYFPGCPFCGRVLAFMEEYALEVPKKNIHENDSVRSELVKIGGKSQVPCLVIDGKALYESNDIIDWMKTNLLK